LAQHQSITYLLTWTTNHLKADDITNAVKKARIGLWHHQRDAGGLENCQE
jgi:hypothetical protein